MGRHRPGYHHPTLIAPGTESGDRSSPGVLRAPTRPIGHLLALAMEPKKEQACAWPWYDVSSPFPKHRFQRSGCVLEIVWMVLGVQLG